MPGKDGTGPFGLGPRNRMCRGAGGRGGCGDEVIRFVAGRLVGLMIPLAAVAIREIRSPSGLLHRPVLRVLGKAGRLGVEKRKAGTSARRIVYRTQEDT